MVSLLRFILLLWTVHGVSCQDCCRNDDVRLVGGATEFEGRVEVCRSGIWGTVCQNNWNTPDTDVVCRQVTGITSSGTGNRYILSAPFGQGTGPILWTDTLCSGSEERLVDCLSYNYANCQHNQDVSVNCSESPNITIEASFTDTTILVSWDGSPVPDKYNITVTQIISLPLINQTYSRITEVPNNRSIAEYEALRPGVSYEICVIGFYGWQQKVYSCLNNKTKPISFSITPSEALSMVSCQSGAVGGTLGSVTLLLVLLLVVACAGLAYPRCIRHRIKGSNISEFLDKVLYLKTDEAVKIAGHTAVENKYNMDNTSDTVYEDYEVLDPPSPQIKASSIPRHNPTAKKDSKPPAALPRRETSRRDQHPPPTLPKRTPSKKENQVKPPTLPRRGTPATSKFDESEDKYYEMEVQNFDSPTHMNYEVPINDDTVSQHPPPTLPKRTPSRQGNQVKPPTLPKRTPSRKGNQVKPPTLPRRGTPKFDESEDKYYEMEVQNSDSPTHMDYEVPINDDIISQ